MTLLSTLASTHQAHYKLKAEKFQQTTSLKDLENELWQSFLTTTPFRGLVIDLETAFQSFVKNSVGSLPGMDVVVDSKIRPDLSQSKFNQPGLAGELSYYVFNDYS